MIFLKLFVYPHFRDTMLHPMVDFTRNASSRLYSFLLACPVIVFRRSKYISLLLGSFAVYFLGSLWTCDWLAATFCYFGLLYFPYDILSIFRVV